MQLREEALVHVDGWEQSIQCLFMTLNADWERNPSVALHYHDYIEFLYGLEGSAQVAIGDRTYPMEPGDLLVVNAREAHDVVLHKGLTRYFVVKFLPQLLYAQGQSLIGLRYLLPLWQKEMLFSPALPAVELGRSGVTTFLQEMMHEFTEKSIGYELVLQADILKIFTWILRCRCPQPQGDPSGMNPELQYALLRALQLAQTHFADWTVRDAAHACNLSYSYFSRSFKQLFGIRFVRIWSGCGCLKANGC